MPDLLGPLGALRATSGDTSAARKSLIFHVAISLRVIENCNHRSFSGSDRRPPRWQAWWMRDMAHDWRDWKYTDIPWSKACTLGATRHESTTHGPASARSLLLEACLSEPCHLIRGQGECIRPVGVSSIPEECPPQHNLKVQAGSCVIGRPCSAPDGQSMRANYDESPSEQGLD
jgi:hypothetical protein